MGESRYNQFITVLRKNWLLQKKKKCLTFFEILLPSLFCLVLISIRYLLHSEFKAKATTEAAFQVLPQFDFRKLKPPNGSWFLAYCPNATKLEEIMKEVSLTLKINFDKDYGFKNEKDLEKNLTTISEVFGAIVFTEDSFYGNDWKEKIKYKIRLRAEKYEGFKSTSSFLNPRNGWLTNKLMPSTTINGPRQVGQTKGGSKPGYFVQGFLTIQQAVDMILIKSLGGEVSAMKSFLKIFPFPPYMADKFIFILQTQLPFLLMVSFSVIAPTICSEIVYEKESKLKEAMKLMGLKSWINWSAWFFKYFIIMFLCVIIMTSIFHTPFNGSYIITYTDPTITFTFLFLYSLNIIIFCFFITTIFNKATTAAAAGTIIFLFTYFPHFYFFGRYAIMNVSSRLLLCLVLNLGLCQGCRVLAKFEEIGVGLQWNNIAHGPNLGETFSMAHVLCMLLVNLFVFGLLTCYFDAVRPGSFGTAQAWYFPFSRTYWRRRLKLVVANGETDRLVGGKKEELVEEGNKDSLFEKIPPDAKIGISMQGLTKKFEGSTTPAVNNVSMDIKEGGITALLGHNGAGKTTTMSLLTGFLQPTSGTATINGFDIQDDMPQIRRSLGLCPQYNILFDSLTVKEHLVFFAKLKGCTKKKLNSEVDKMIESIGLVDKRNTRSSELSGGMKRKLCVGISLIGGSKFVILDEPSSGMDPEARRQMWTMLKEQKKGRTMILSTHYMDEADYLGDRIAIMADGRLHCYGTPMFLKKKYGVGYHMTVVKSKNCDVEKLKQLIQQRIPSATLENDVGAELSYILPNESAPLFPALFELFENESDKLGVESFGASVTTIEEVFIKVERGNETKTLAGMNKDEEENLLSTSPEKENPQQTTIKVDDPKLSDKRKKGLSLFLQQMKAMLVKRLLNTWRNRLITLVQLLIPLIFCFIAISTTTIATKADNPVPRQLTLNDYKDPITFYSTSSDYRDNSSHLACMRRVVKNLNGQSRYVNDLDHNGNMDAFLVKQAIDSFYHYRTHLQVAAEVSNDRFIGYYNDESFHTIAISLSVVNNAWLKCLSNSSKEHSIETTNHPLPWLLSNKVTVESNSSSMLAYAFSNLLMFGMAFLTATFAIFLIKERLSGAKSSQQVSGVNTEIFWFSTFLWDYVNYFVPAASIIILLLVIRVEDLSEPIILRYLALLLMLFGWAVLPLVYLMSFLFNKASSGYVWISIFNYFTGTMLSLIIFIMRIPIFNLVSTAELLEWLFYVFFPSICFEKGFQDLYKNYKNNQTCSSFAEMASLDVVCSTAKILGMIVPCCPESCGSFCLSFHENYLAWEYPGLGRPAFFMLIQGAFFFSLLILIESDLLNRIRSALVSSVTDVGSNKSHNAIGNASLKTTAVEEDSDVKNEREEVMQLSENDLEANNVVLFLKNLSKVYSGHFTAVDDLCLKVFNGEVFGLLGVNGAGKTSTFKMLTGDETISKGKIFINSINAAKHLGRTRKFVGYCPQFDALIDQMTTKENLVMHARLRGMYPDHIEEVSMALMKKLMLHQYKDRLSHALSGGNRRKLGIAIAVIANPMLVFLDEPSAGMDPVARREMWNCVSALKASGKTVILTSHSMEECEALCTRLAIMVNGQFRCLGSCQHLKSKFGLGYSVILKPSFEQQNLEELRAFMFEQYPGAVIEYESDELIGYRVDKNLPNASLSKIFRAIEANKQKLRLEDYSVGQTTLEQVFINFAKTQLESTRKNPRPFYKRLCA